jgi:hypothetical protein
MRLHLHAGSYLVRGRLAVQDDRYGVVFYETRGDLALDVGGRNLTGIVELVPDRQADALKMVSYLEKLLARGELDRAHAVLQQLDGSRLRGYEQVSTRLQFLQQKLSEGLVQLNALQQLGPGSYNSSIVVLERLDAIVTGLSRNGADLTIRYGGERFSPARRRRSMIESRDALLGLRLDLAEQALRARSYLEALIEYHTALSNPELWRPEQEAPPETQERIDAFDQAHAALTDQVQTELLALLSGAIDRYQRGELEQAQADLARVTRALAKLQGELQMPEAEATAASHMRDIESIVRAKGLEKEERWAEVVDVYASVANVNPLVRQGIVEARSRQGLGRGPAAPPAEPSPGELELPTDL